jgi:cyclopropane-fatty-acyl-phospholipid synthase
MQLLAEEQRSKILGDLFDNYSGPAFSVRFWDSWSWRSSEGKSPECTIEINHPDALKMLLAGPNEIALGEAFIRKDLDVRGDIFSVFLMGEHLLDRPKNMRVELMRRAGAALLGFQNVLRKGRKHSPARDQAAITHHYDQPFEFYKSWLGRPLTYSCAYFANPTEGLDGAQDNKIDLIFRKLRLQPSEQFLDIGCGWGSLILHAAKNYGACARGITLSKEQARVASERIADAHLTQSCKVQLRDYRSLCDDAVSYDKVASIGMFEHVGLNKLPQYFSTVWHTLRPCGAFLNHGIARAHHSPARKSSFIDRYVFPDGELVTLSQALTSAEAAGFEVRDVENLREHYELTLRHWVKDLQRNENSILQYVPETTYRVWLLFMAGSAAAFRRGDIALYQMLLIRPDRGSSRLPLRREDWYLQDDLREGIMA